MNRQPGKQLRLAADLQPELIGPACVQDFLNHLAQLVHFDGEHPAVTALVVVFRDGRLERLVERLHAMAQNILEPNQQRELQSAPARFLDHVRNIHHRPRFLKGLGNHVACFIDVKIAGAPAVDVKQFSGGLNIPAVRGHSVFAHYCVQQLTL